MSYDMPHILIVDDDVRILKLLKQFLQKNNYLVSTTSEPKKTFELIDNFHFDLIILDVMMPDITGHELAEKIKSQDHNMPIVMLTALSEPEDRIKGLEIGANDYITKPFDPRELILRINNLISMRTQRNLEEDVVRFGNNQYNLKTCTLTKNDETINLSSTELQLLNVFINAKNAIISREEISKQMNIASERSVDVQITRLRNKIENDPKNPQFLKTIRNKGYVLYT